MKEGQVKKNKEIVANLNSGKTSNIINSIKKLRIVGNTKYLPDIFNAYNKNSSKEVVQEISSFMCDLKDDNAAPYIINFLKTIKSEEHKILFTSCCWQSRISFQNYTNFFTELIIMGSYQLAIEAFTVIEECLLDIQKEELNKQVKALKESMNKIDEDKKPFIHEVIKTMQFQER